MLNILDIISANLLPICLVIIIYFRLKKIESLYFNDKYLKYKLPFILSLLIILTLQLIVQNFIHRNSILYYPKFFGGLYGISLVSLFLLPIYIARGIILFIKAKWWPRMAACSVGVKRSFAMPSSATCSDASC